MTFWIFFIIGLIIIYVAGIKFHNMYGYVKHNLLLINAIYIIFGVFGGICGMYIMYYIEKGYWGGHSYFGSLFLVPFIFVIYSIIFKMPYWKILDFAVIAQCILLIVLKIDCLISGCCGGRYLYTINETSINFPSQILESLNGLFLLIVLWSFAKKEKYRGKIYPMFMIFYGITRFILNFGREGLTPFMLGLPNSNIWSIVSILAGIACYLYLSNKETMQKIAQAKQN